jgi:hypothetical protein
VEVISWRTWEWKIYISKHFAYVLSMFRTSAESQLIKARHRPHDSGGLSRTPLMYRQQAEPHEPVARTARITCLVTCHIVHITREHSESHEHE